MDGNDRNTTTDINTHRRDKIQEVYVNVVYENYNEFFFQYLYPLFSDDSLLDERVFNTKGHPLPIKDVNPDYRISRHNFLNLL